MGSTPGTVAGIWLVCLLVFLATTLLKPILDDELGCLGRLLAPRFEPVPIE